MPMPSCLCYLHLRNYGTEYAQLGQWIHINQYAQVAIPLQLHLITPRTVEYLTPVSALYLVG